jgi:hypothetical protein
MSYTVVWKRTAENKLARFWMDAQNRHQVAQAADAIDSTLKQAPSDAGESRPGDRRVVYEPPLGAIFEVREQDRTVIVLDVWRYSKRSAR